jgi:hypothetical protein
MRTSHPPVSETATDIGGKITFGEPKTPEVFARSRLPAASWVRSSSTWPSMWSLGPMRLSSPPLPVTRSTEAPFGRPCGSQRLPRQDLTGADSRPAAHLRVADGRWISQPSDIDEVDAERWAADITTPPVAGTSGSASAIHRACESDKSTPHPKPDPLLRMRTSLRAVVSDGLSGPGRRSTRRSSRPSASRPMSSRT